MDDVFHADFLSGVIFTGKTNGKDVEISPGAKTLLESLGTRWIEVLDTDAADEIPLPGPYITAGQDLFLICRLYDDVQGAFMTGPIPASQS